MRQDPIQVLQAAGRAVPTPAAPGCLLIAGATGVLGNEVLRQLAGSPAYPQAQVLAREPIRTGLRGVALTLVPGDAPADWPCVAAHTGVVLFDPPRLYYDRERALWTPQPAQLPEVAAWMRRCGARTLAVVLPHAQGRLPEALKRGLASLDEQAVAAMGFERLLVLRTPQKPRDMERPNPLQRLAGFMLGTFRYMVPSSEQPVRAAKMAQLLAVALELAPPGIHIAAPELVWRAAQGDMRTTALQWLRP
jgi:hypothetical protein